LGGQGVSPLRAGNSPVNGTAAGAVTYPPTQFWGLIGTVTVPVQLHAGVNTIWLSNAGGIADLDFADVAFRG
jgi:hypothetical protein